MFIGWLTCNLEVLLPHSLCRSTTANAPANRQMPIASVVRRHSKKWKTDRITEGKIFEELSALATSTDEIDNDSLLSYFDFSSADNSSQIFYGKNWVSIISTTTHNDWKPWNYALTIEKQLLTFRTPGRKVYFDLTKKKRTKNKLSMTTRKKRKPVSSCRENAYRKVLDTSTFRISTTFLL